MSRTPTPWRVSSFEQGAGGDARVVMGADGFAVAHLMDRSTAEHEADAAFIVRAVNAHDDLVKALDWAMISARNDLETTRLSLSGPQITQSLRDTYEEAKRELDTAESVLARAKGPAA